RWLHYSYVHEMDLSDADDEVYITFYEKSDPPTVGKFCADLHSIISSAYNHFLYHKMLAPTYWGSIYTAVKQAAACWDIDLYAEFQAKMAYNETRAYRHGGKNL